MDEFVAQLRADYGVLSAISAEHMANFDNMDAVANEELKLGSMVDEILVNADQVDPKYLKKINGPITYGEGDYDCSINPSKLTKDFYRPVSFSLKTNQVSISIKTRLIGRQNLPGLAAAAILGDKLGLSSNEIKAGLEQVKPIPGRMQLLLGKKQSLLIDDTYNASPEAVIAALNTLYEISSTSRIAVLGQMNELGKFSEAMHIKVGAECDPGKLDLIVTIGTMQTIT
jgi:UDP-N-acetylmuramoyl-tripeptide--D-alanyl-D-alanine ligase